MTVNVSNSEPKESVSLDERQNLGIGRQNRPEKLQPEQKHVSIPQVTDSEFADNHRMGQHVTFVQYLQQPHLRLAQMVDPNRRVDKNHAGSGRRRAGTSKSG